MCKSMDLDQLGYSFKVDWLKEVGLSAVCQPFCTESGIPPSLGDIKRRPVLDPPPTFGGRGVQAPVFLCDLLYK